MTQVTINGNFLPAPAVVDSLNLSVAERSDVIVDFSSYQVGTKINLVNRLEQTDPKGPSGKLTDPGDQILQFIVGDAKNYDPSRIPILCARFPRLTRMKSSKNGCGHLTTTAACGR